jgi:ribonuclease HI
MARRLDQPSEVTVMSFRVYCDGSGTTGGPAGIAFVVYADSGDWFGEGSMSLRSATNQQAEILAATFALDSLHPLSRVVVVSDSEYVVQNMTLRIDDWVARGWRTAAGKPVKNQGHWQRLIDAASRHGQAGFEWTRGHVGTYGNERAHELAGLARQQALAAVELERARKSEDGVQPAGLVGKPIPTLTPVQKPARKKTGLAALSASELLRKLLVVPTICDSAWNTAYGAPPREKGETRETYIRRVLA